MSNSSVEVPVPQEFEVYAQQIDRRISALEHELTQLKEGMVSPSTGRI
jgi:hypothetical protein